MDRFFHVFYWLSSNIDREALLLLHKYFFFRAFHIFHHTINAMLDKMQLLLCVLLQTCTNNFFSRTLTIKLYVKSFLSTLLKILRTRRKGGRVRGVTTAQASFAERHTTKIRQNEGNKGGVRQTLNRLLVC